MILDGLEALWRNGPVLTRSLEFAGLLASAFREPLRHNGRREPDNSHSG
jgi:hypothetical protein